MLPMRFFRSRSFSAGNAASFLLTASLFGAVFFMAQFLQTGLGYGPLGAGLRLLSWTVTLSVCAPIAGALVDRIGARPFIVVGLLLQGAGMGWIAILVAVFAGAGGYSSAQAFSDGFAPAIGVSAGLALLGSLVATALPGRRAAPSAAPARAFAEAGG